MNTKSCPLCGHTMVKVHNYWGIIEGYWWCINCWHTERIPAEYTLWYSDNTGELIDEQEEEPHD
jgi:hypothetical protein